MTVFVPTGVVNGSSLPEFLRYGPVNLRPRVDYNFSYGNGIQSAPGNQVDTIIQSLSPGLACDLGRHWVLDYTPTFRFYSSRQFRDSIDHSVSLAGTAKYEDWQFGLTQSFTDTSDPMTETATQTDQQIFGTALSANRMFSEKMSADFGLNQAIASASGLQSSRNWSTMNWLNYEFWPRLNAGVGAGVGYLSVDTGSDQVYEDLQARVNWRATDKISFKVSGGVDYRQFMAAGQSDQLNPIFDAAIQYQPFKNTQISLHGSNTIGASNYNTTSQTTETSSVGLILNQRLLKKFNLNLGLSYTETKDTAASGLAGLPGSNRTDNYTSYSASLSRGFLRRGTWAITYQYNDNRSTEAGFASHGSQIGFQVGYRY
jgi:hypothetical protein